METGRGACGMEESKYHSHFEEGQEEGNVILEGSQPHLNLWAHDEANNHSNVIKDMKVTGRSQYGFMNGNSNLTAFYDDMISLVEKVRTMDTV